LTFATPTVEHPSSNFSPGDKPSWDLYSRCVHCGLCLDQCPTYRVLGTEMDSPRGRIYQMLQVDEGRLTLGESFVIHIDRCLGCLNCQTACPSGVQYGALLESSRAQIQQNFRRPWLQRKIRDFFYGRVLPSFSKLSFWATIVRFYQRSGLQSLARAIGFLKLMGVEDLDALSPRMESDFSFRDLGKVFPAEGVRRGRVALLIGCISSVAFAELNRATIRVLTRNGIEVCIPKAQSCCGALHAHAGLIDQARVQARRNIDAMLSPDVDAIVTNAAGCGSTMKEYASLLEHDPQYADRARQFVAKTRDITEYLAAVGLVTPKRMINQRVTYSDPCHLVHAQGIRKQPRDLLMAIGVNLVDMPRADSCCGSAGVYNVAQNEISMKILDEKMEYVAMAEPEIIATANVGCMLQLAAGAKRKGLKAEVVLVVELLDRAF
jgi:glycolate oxidase iron-sulfur subunit